MHVAVRGDMMPHPPLQPFAPRALRPAALGAAGISMLTRCSPAKDNLSAREWSGVLLWPAVSLEIEAPEHAIIT